MDRSLETHVLNVRSVNPCVFYKYWKMSFETGQISPCASHDRCLQAAINDKWVNRIEDSWVLRVAGSSDSL